MATPTTAFNLSGLASRLVREGLLDQPQAENLHDTARKNNRSFFSHLAESKLVESSLLIRCTAEEFGMPVFDIAALDAKQVPIGLVGEKMLRKHRLLPVFKRGTKLFVGIADPTNTGALDEIKFHTGMGVEPILVDHTKLDNAIEEILKTQETSFDDLADQGLEDLDISAEDDEAGAGDEDAAAGVDTPIVRFVNKIMLDAITKEASDIHIEPYEERYRVRYRIDGLLHEVAAPPLALAGRIAARVKILSRLDIAERRVPQDGRMKMRLSKNRAIDFRVSTLPTIFGEKVVIRILDSTAGLVGIENLGMEPQQIESYEHAFTRPYGMILVTGPTGSGKTVSLYTALGSLNQEGRNISTVEDPVEIHMAGVNQVNINERAGLTFAASMRAFLRQDPDVIMVGEIRDLETADIAIKASQTGHLVLSTLHTNDAPATLTRLLNMGVAPFNVASAVHLIMAQRLARRLCGNCKQEAGIPPEALEKAGYSASEAKEVKTFAPVGCEQCTDGYKGRVGIFQVMPISETMGRLIMEGCSQHQIEDQAATEGILNLRQAGLLKVKAGVTSLEEVERVTNI